ncbi:hypothetical protein CYMTET_7872 [Cymbomonas tetramitiformis]|uniref:Uncharacterized protein n=1 Tax=Cymbomonas tetramitiformis TaxID=36881 RepID=A0AAE0LGF3_9CHLO|nr:hypothetical protein CYMTET_7872 [Cymbomonas tetramitiformis]
MKVNLRNTEEFEKIALKLHESVYAYLQGSNLSEEKKKVLRSRMNTMEDNVLATIKDSVLCAGVEWRQDWRQLSDDADRQVQNSESSRMPLPLVLPTDDHCLALEGEVGELAEEVARRRSSLRAKALQQAAANLELLHPGPKSTAQGLDISKENLGALVVQDPSLSSLEEQLERTVAALPSISKRVGTSLARVEHIRSALQANRKRPPPGQVECTVRELSSEDESYTAPCVGMNTRRRVAQALNRK